MLPSLLVSAAVAPLVLSRSDNRRADGLKWFLELERRLSHRRAYQDMSFADWLTACVVGVVSAIPVIAVIPMIGNVFVF